MNDEVELNVEASAALGSQTIAEQSVSGGLGRLRQDEGGGEGVGGRVCVRRLNAEYKIAVRLQ
jgi:hypothetical protein